MEIKLDLTWWTKITKTKTEIKNNEKQIYIDALNKIILIKWQKHN